MEATHGSPTRRHFGFRYGNLDDVKIRPCLSLYVVNPVEWSSNQLSSDLDPLNHAKDSGMHDPPVRRFTLADAMLLVAATAPGLVLLRIAAGLGLFSTERGPNDPWGRDFIEQLAIAGGCLLVPIALLVLVLSLRGRGTQSRDIAQGPGFTACVALVVASVLPIAWFAVRVAKADEFNRSNEISLNFNNSFGRLELYGGPMIAGAWLALALSGRWRPGETWLDRLGCFVGACYIIMFVYTKLYLFIAYLP